MSKTLTLSIILIFFTSCVSTGEWLKTKSENFQLGYKNGCQNGEDMAENSYVEKANEGDAMYKKLLDYREGWDEGYETCYSDKIVEIMMRRRL